MGAGGIALIANSSFGGYIRERAVAVVAVENISAQAGDVEIGPAIIVVVADSTALGEAGRRDPALSVTSVNVPS